MCSLRATSVEWPNEYTLKTNEPLGQDCVTFVCLSISGRLDPSLLEEKHHELVKQWPVLGGDLVTNVRTNTRSSRVYKIIGFFFLSSEAYEKEFSRNFRTT